MFDRGFAANPGWDLNVTWFTEDGLPKKGVLTVEVFAGDGMLVAGGLVDRILRSTLSSLVLVGQRDISTEIKSISDVNDNITPKYAQYRLGRQL